MSIEPAPWRPCLRCERQRLLDGQGGEVHVVFGAVLHVAAVLGGELRGCEVGVGAGAGDGVEFACLVGEGFEKGGAACAGAAEDDWRARMLASISSKMAGRQRQRQTSQNENSINQNRKSSTQTFILGSS